MTDQQQDIHSGLVSAGVADLKKSPDLHAETVSQAVLNTELSILEKGDEDLRVVLSDGYQGWMHGERIVLTDSSYDRSSLDYKIMSDISICRAGHESDADIILRIPFRARLSVQAVEGSFTQLKLPSGLTGCVSSSDLVRTDKIPRLTPDTADLLLRQACSFIGVAYLWGGVTPFGFDCSGLVQTVFGFFGVSLPRDACEQKACGREFELENDIPGDLLFFPGHVATYLGQHRFVHANLKAGRVSVNSFDENSPDFRKDLKESLSCVRRVI